MQLVHGVAGQYERLGVTVQEGPTKAIRVWLNLGIIFLLGTGDTTVCLTSFRQCLGSDHEKMVGGIISPRRRATAAFQ